MGRGICGDAERDMKARGITDAERNMQRSVMDAERNMQRSIMDAERNMQRSIINVERNTQRSVMDADMRMYMRRIIPMCMNTMMVRYVNAPPAHRREKNYM